MSAIGKANTDNLFITLKTIVLLPKRTIKELITTMSTVTDLMDFKREKQAQSLLDEFIAIKQQLGGVERATALANWSNNVDQWHKQDFRLAFASP